MMSQIEQQLSQFRQVVLEYKHAYSYRMTFYEREREAETLFNELHIKGSASQAYLDKLCRDEEEATRERLEYEHIAEDFFSSIYEWITCFQKAAIESIGIEIELARLIENIPYSTFVGARSRGNFQAMGSDFARHAMQHKCQNPEDSQQLLAYFKDKRLWDEAITVARQGYEQFREDAFRKEWLGLLEKAGKLDGLIALLQEDLGKSPGNLELAQRLAQLILKSKGLYNAVAFLNAEIGRAPQNQELREYFRTFLIDALKNAEAPIRRAAINILRDHKVERTAEPLTRLFDQEPLAEIRLLAVQTLVNIQGNGSVPSLWKGLADSTPEVRSYAAQALVEVGDAGTVERLVQVLKAETDSTVREAILSALGKLDNRPRKWWEKMLNSRPWVH